MIAGAIDVGTNSVKLLIADGRLRTLEERVIVTRLGEGLARTGRIAEGAARRTLAALRECRRRCERRRCGRVLAAGTEALRRASNAAAFLERASREAGVELRVLSGVEEARLSFLGGTADWADRDVATIEIGGGSVQVSTGRGGRLVRGQSLPHGAVTLTESVLRSDPPTPPELDAAGAEIRRLLRRLRLRVRRPFAVGLGGTAATLGTMWCRGNFGGVHGLRLALGDLEGWLAEVASEPLAVRRRRRGLEPDRADIIVGGGIILCEAMRAIGAGAITLSTKGLRHGLLRALREERA
jgi:exopolyphosphatase/guanosine-5'-triphosphate,3'-diphosphate pyrophosphatase